MFNILLLSVRFLHKTTRKSVEVLVGFARTNFVAVVYRVRCCFPHARTSTNKPPPLKGTAQRERGPMRGVNVTKDRRASVRKTLYRERERQNGQTFFFFSFFSFFFAPQCQNGQNLFFVPSHLSRVFGFPPVTDKRRRRLPFIAVCRAVGVTATRSTAWYRFKITLNSREDLAWLCYNIPSTWCLVYNRYHCCVEKYKDGLYINVQR